MLIKVKMFLKVLNILNVMNEFFKDWKKNYVLIFSIGLIVLIIAWPIYFFSLSNLGLILSDLEQLIFFSIVEIGLIILLVVFWKIYSKLVKS